MSWHAMVSTTLAFVGCGMLLCRVDKMLIGRTHTRVFLQHAGLAVAMFSSVVVQFTDYAEWAPAAMYAGVVYFLLLGLGRWRYGPPRGVDSPLEVDEPDLRGL